MSLVNRIARTPRELKMFVVASLTMGIAYSIVDATFNNFLNDKFALSVEQRSLLELPRELPGFLVVFISALLWFLCSRRLGALSLVLGIVGTVLIGFASRTYAALVACLFIYSLGQHMFMPIASTIGMELAEEGKTGTRLGQLNAVRNLAAILGSALVYVVFKFLGLSFNTTFILAALGFTMAALMMFSMKPEQNLKRKDFLKLHKEYRLYYILSILYGSRKQLFITFAPWVLVTIFNQPTQTMATLITIGGIIGILFQPILGRAIDRFGERIVLATEAVLLVFVCLGYGFSKSMFPASIAFLLTCTCYLLDQILMSVGMARSTYMKKIAMQGEDVQPALTAGTTIDHIFSISVALLGGVIWNNYGFQYVFLLGMLIAAINFVVALQIRVPDSPHTVPSENPLLVVAKPSPTRLP
jgi:predicted MFS family arabinose efflux permease